MQLLVAFNLTAILKIMQPNMFLNVVSDTLANAEHFSWHFVVFLSIGLMMLIANVLRRKIPFMRKVLMPTAVIAGFLALIIKEVVFAASGVQNITVGYSYVPGEGPSAISFGTIFDNALSAIVMHTLPIAFIALTLRDKPNDTKNLSKSEQKKQRVGTIKSGSVLASTYMLQAILGLVISIVLGFTFMRGTVNPGLGALLPIAFGQGPPQSHAMGGAWDQMFIEYGYQPNHFRNFALALAASSFLF